MPALTLTALVPWVIIHGYFIFFLATIIEGTMVTIAAGVASGFGYFNIVIIILISISGDLIADTIFYFIGYFSRNLIIENHGHHFGLTKERLDKIDNMVHMNFRKAMLIVKISPFIPVPGLIAIGSTRASLKKYIEMSLLVTMPKSAFFALLGFYSGKTYIYLTNTVTNGSYIAGGLILFVIIIYFIYQKITFYFSKKAGIQ